jgi:hypothetical protein
MKGNGYKNSIIEQNVASTGSTYDIFPELVGSVNYIDEIEILASSITSGDGQVKFYVATNASGMTSTTDVIGSTYVENGSKIQFKDSFTTNKTKVGIKLESDTASTYRFNVRYYYK